MRYIPMVRTYSRDLPTYYCTYYCKTLDVEAHCVGLGFHNFLQRKKKIAENMSYVLNYVPLGQKWTHSVSPRILEDGLSFCRR
jgi:hypothetical protein